MRLSELNTGDKGVVVKVLGHGGFRKRIVEMGFIKGKMVEVLLSAPLRDPVKYRIMGYEISLRREEASMIEIISMEEAKHLESLQHSDVTLPDNHGLIGEDMELNEEQMKRLALHKRRTINVALVGNPNCGKTSLFNIASGAHEHVGNYSGVTVDAKEGHFEFEGYTFNIVDLPGTYSLSCYSPEELYVRKQIVEKTPDIVINVVDASNLERNLYLTTQLIDMNLRTVVALNMYDELESSGNKLDYRLLGQLFGVPMIPTVCRSGKGIDLLFHVIINMYEGVDFIGKDGTINKEVFEELRDWHKQYHKADNKEEEHEEDFTSEVTPRNNVFHHIHINHGHDIEEGIEAIKAGLAKNENLRSHYSLRYLSIKLLEKDRDFDHMVAGLPNGEEILETRDQEAKRIQEVLHEDSETAVMNAKYGFISGALKETFIDAPQKDVRQVTKWIDSIVTNRYLGFPIFFIVMGLMFEITFVLGQYPMDWIDAGVGALIDFLKGHMSEGPLRDMLTDGVLGGVGAVIVFLPQILILYFFISLMEESGYMARAAFIMDKVMHGMGLHGKSFIPLIMGFGCNVPAEMATRTIESPKSRLVTMLILPLMSCSARLPVYLIITGIFFAKYQALIILALYAVGIFLAVIMARVFSAFLVKGDNTPFVMELPPYRYPTAKAIFRHTWEKGKQYLYKMGHIILVASIIVWFLGYYPNHYDYATDAEQQENSYLGHIGKAIAPVLEPCGFDWKMDVGLLAGAGAKELVASTMGVLYSNNADAESSELSDNIRAEGITPLSSLAYLLFVLIYFPCIATITAIKNETGTWKWALFTAVYTTALAWLVATLVYQVGGLLV
ncbi:MAG: ferrous iron transport protein B [Bacteroidaceae bacterium]|nr:ferrous iron transport protein B [Bacteroidaceae bacterium]MBQ9884802.1 ferrous iron transport protein B [Bacteroidaceae bacterium]